jgi:hypothetical protein
LLVVASGEIGAADRAGEQSVANDRQTLDRIEIDDASGRMPRTVQDIKSQLPDLDLSPSSNHRSGVTFEAFHIP